MTVIVILAILAAFLAAAGGRSKKPTQPAQGPKTGGPREEISRAVRELSFEGWSWKDRREDIIRCRKENGFDEDYRVTFDRNGAVMSLVRVGDGKKLSPSPCACLSEVALLSFYEGILAEKLGELQALADGIATGGARWVKAESFTGGVPERRELRILAKAFEHAGFRVLALRFTDGALKLGVER